MLWKMVMALVLAAGFIFLRLTLGPLAGLGIGFSLLIPAALLGGVGGGMATAAMTMFFCTLGMWLLHGHTAAISPNSPPFWPPAFAFWIIGSICGVVGASLRHAVRRLHDAHSDLFELSERHREVAAEMRAIVEQASAGILRTDLSGRIEIANARFAELVGHPVEEILGHVVMEYTHPDDIDLTVRSIHNLAQSQLGGWQAEKRYVRPSGEVVTVLVNVRTLQTDDGTPYGFLTVIVDISATRRAEQALRITRHSFRTVADSIPVLIWLAGKDEEEHFVNQAYLDFTGQARGDVTTQSWANSLHPDDYERVMLAVEKGLKSGEPFTVTARYRRHDGQWRWLRSVQQPRLDPDGRRIGTVGSAFDMTEVYEANTRIEESEARFRAVANSAPAMIWMVDAQGHTEFGNKRFRSAFSGRTPVRLMAAWRDMTHPEDRLSLTRIISDAQRNRRRFSMLGRINHPVFGERWVRTEAAPRHDANGHLIGYTGVSLDVTDSQRAERDLKRINELLEERVNAVLAEKAKAEADLLRSNRLEAIGRLTGGVAHDFNNLLTVIMGGLDIILRTEDPARRKKMAEAALAAAKRGERLTGQLLAFSRRQTLTPTKTDLNALIREGEPLLYRAVGDAMTLVFKLKSGVAPTLVDAAKFEAALINLLVNARDACADDGKIVVETAEYRVAPLPPPQLPLSTGTPAAPVKKGQTLHPSDLVPGRYVRVTVSDNGSGMTDEVQRRVFEPFFTTKGVSHGTGLGLSQVYGFTRQSGGSISIQSTLGKGTCIHLFLPWTDLPVVDTAATATPDPTDATTTPSKAAGMGSNGKGAPLRLLLVEDDNDVANVAATLISAEGFEVQRVENATTALKMLNASTFDVVLSDILMPGGISGIELAHKISAQWPALRIVLSSGFPGEVEALKNTPWAFLPKPYTGTQLRAVLEQNTP